MIHSTDRFYPVLHVGSNESFSVHATSEPISDEDMFVDGSTDDTEIPMMTDMDDYVPFPVNWDVLLGIEIHSTTDVFENVIDPRRNSSTGTSWVTKFNHLCRLWSIVFQFIRTSSLACVSLTSYPQQDSNEIVRSSHSTRRG